MKNKNIKEPPKFYINGSCTVTNPFPDGNFCCKNCFLIIYLNDGLSRYKCRLTEEIIDWPETGVGFKCPMILEDVKHDRII